MKIKNLSLLMLALTLTFTACTDNADKTENTPVTPNEKPEEKPTPESSVSVEAAEFVGEYMGDAHTQAAGAYTLIFADNGFEYGGGMLANSAYYVLDVYSDFYEGKDTGYVQFPEGTYTLDLTNSFAKGTISHDYSYYMTTDESLKYKMATFESAELVVTETNATLTAVIDGVKHIVTFEGQATVADKRAEDREFTARNAWIYYYGDHDSKGVADSYLLYLSDIDTEYNLLPNGTYYRLDLFSEIVDKSNGFTIPYGTYVVDEQSTRKPYTVAVGTYSDYVKVDKNGYAEEGGMISAGTVVVDENGITAELHIMGGKHTVKYSGYIPITDCSGAYFD